MTSLLGTLGKRYSVTLNVATESESSAGAVAG
jgi:hypothetical protein